MTAMSVLVIIFTGIFAAAYSRSIGIIILKFMEGGRAYQGLIRYAVK